MTDTICLTKILWKLTGRASLVAQRLKRLPAMQETWVQSLGREDPLEKEMAIHSSILAWRIPWTEEPGGLQSTGSQRVGHNWATSLSLHFQYAPGDQWRNNSRKNKGTEPKQKQDPVVDVTDDRSKVHCCKEQYCIGPWNVRSMIKANWKWSNKRWQEWMSTF